MNSYIVVMATQELHLRRLYGDWGASDLGRSEEETEAAWSPQGYGTDIVRRDLIWSRLGMEVRQELDCLPDGDTRDPHRMLAVLSSGCRVHSSISALMSKLYANGQRHGCKAVSRCLREAIDTLTICSLVRVSHKHLVWECLCAGEE
ncbi:hypothetical protein PoB_006855300 [Plakobranchus ocellatus]|uniref:Uncharacterized protein n=1 Tax=Plakobranchus ocellatus TaxID=259542 RepID=A0AAV4DCU3_9GAST|nr:hypothetical protein PoB_006855300 [Plakobranchus ocellatus]